MAQERVTIEEIDKYIADLPRHKELAKEITDFVSNNEDYSLAQVGQIIDKFYNESIGLSIAEEIKSIF